MSAKIWQDIYNAVQVKNPAFLTEFNSCRTDATVIAFLNSRFPLAGQDWKDKLMSQVPDLLRTMP